ncbi:hypothetical protein P8936_08530 [Edaphobacter paludis]|uniref:Na+/galactose cotransporter n=1 Tax=Edaphobacter paludis TaxID=3035702 RepID=A0AAU7D3E2_9BACT
MYTHLPSLLIAAYFSCTLVIAIRSFHKQKTSNDFLNETGNLPTWVATLSFLAANCGALEIVGLSGIAARYGVQTFHFYWIGAIPAMIFVSFVVLPVYQRSGVRSVPEYLERRFGPEVRLLNASVLLGSTCLTAGISLYALAMTLHVFAGWTFTTCALVAAGVAMTNVLTGGLRGTMRTEILHFFVMFAGLLPLLYLSRHVAGQPAESWSTRTHLWRATPLLSAKVPVDLVGVVIGLGVVIGFSYWCTDFLLMQRALTARSTEAARRVPLYAGFGKLLFSFLVVMPILLVGHSLPSSGKGTLDQTAAMLMRSLYDPRFLWVGILALVASLMTGLGGNISAFSALWTQEIYRSALRPDRPEQHYIFVGRIASVLCVVLSLAGACATLYFESLSEFMLAIFSLTLAPFFAVVIMGVISRRASSAGAIAGALCGIVMGGITQLAYRSHWLHSGSELNANFHTAIVSFGTSLIACLVATRLIPAEQRLQPANSSGLAEIAVLPASKTLYALAVLLVVCCILFNILWS